MQKCTVFLVGKVEPKQYATSDLRSLYIFADKCDIPLIRNMCKQQLVEKEEEEALEVAVALELDDVKVLFS